MFDKLTDRVRKVLVLANQEAQRFNHEYIGCEHILLGIFKDGSGVAADVLKSFGMNLETLRKEVEKHVKPGCETTLMAKLPQTPQMKKVLERAIEEARNASCYYVGTEHLLLALCYETDGVISEIFQKYNITLSAVKEKLSQLLVKKHTKSNKVDIETEELAPFRFRFVVNESRYELLDSDGRILESKIFHGAVGAYIFNALRKHEATQQLLREIKESLSKDELVRRIDNLLD